MSLCPYCDFVVSTGRAARGPGSRIGRFLEALHVELELRAAIHDAVHGAPGSATRPALRSVYVGGGTPSLLSAQQVGALLDAVERRFGLASDVEVTLEANPGRDELGDLAGFRSAGVDRLSLGAQSLVASELRRVGRRHLPGDVARAVEAARAVGFRSLSLDLLTDLPGQTLDSWRSTLRRALDLEPEHLSIYALTLDDPDLEGLTGPDGDHLPLRPGSRRWRERAVPMQDEDRAVAMDGITDDLLEPAGYTRYELSNHARSGHESRHNLGYWTGVAYEALGPGAHAFDGSRVRRWNAARLDRYVAALVPVDGSPATLPPGAGERLDGSTARAESAILRLRLRAGLTGAQAADPAVAPALGWARERGLVEAVDGRVRLTPRGRLLSNEVFSRLLPSA